MSMHESTRHRLLHADATDRDILPAASVDLVVTSPPYNVGMPYSGEATDDSITADAYAEFTDIWIQNCLHWTRSTGRMCVNVAVDKSKNGKQPLSADITHSALQAGWKYHATIMWNEGNVSRRTAWGSWISASAPNIINPMEVVLVFYKDKWKRDRQGENDITPDEFKEWVWGEWKFNGESAKRVGHDAPFPRELPRRCIKLLSFKGDVVLDPFVGSGTTSIEALLHERHAIGIEKESHYHELARQRIAAETAVLQ